MKQYCPLFKRNKGKLNWIIKVDFEFLNVCYINIASLKCWRRCRKDVIWCVRLKCLSLSLSASSATPRQRSLFPRHVSSSHISIHIETLAKRFFIIKFVFSANGIWKSELSLSEGRKFRVLQLIQNTSTVSIFAKMYKSLQQN